MRCLKSNDQCLPMKLSLLLCTVGHLVNTSKHTHTLQCYDFACQKKHNTTREWGRSVNKYGSLRDAVEIISFASMSYSFEMNVCTHTHTKPPTDRLLKTAVWTCGHQKDLNATINQPTRTNLIFPSICPPNNRRSIEKKDDNQTRKRT